LKRLEQRLTTRDTKSGATNSCRQRQLLRHSWSTTLFSVLTPSHAAFQLGPKYFGLGFFMRLGLASALGPSILVARSAEADGALLPAIRCFSEVEVLSRAFFFR